MGALFVSYNLTNNLLRITISGVGVEFLNRRQLMILIGDGDWGQYFYEYSCEKQEWILKEVKYGRQYTMVSR
jgi:hypothetical protein